MTRPEHERRYYTDQVTPAVVAGGIFALIFAVGFLVARTAEARVWAAICLAVFVALTLRALKMGVYPSPRHLKIVNTWKTHSLSWSQVAPR